jgi:pimeloyl-ACP methyl ester carboxylesterase
VRKRLLICVVVSGCATHPPPAVPDRDAAFNNHRLTLHFANPGAPASRPLLVFATGDGGMHRKDLDMYRRLDGWGYPLVGFDARDYVKHLGPSEVTTPERLADDYRHMIEAARNTLHLEPARPVVLVGVSRGAGLSVVAAGELHDSVAGVVAIALTREEEYVHWVHHVLPRREVMVDIEEYLPELGKLPLAVVQSAHDKYMPGPVARALIGPDGPRRWLQIIDAPNHTFSGARDEMYQATRRAIGWIENRESRTASREPRG